MSGLIFDTKACDLCQVCVQKCPFHALTLEQDHISVGAGCKMCKACIKLCPNKAISIEEKKAVIDKQAYHDILIYVEHLNGRIHPVTYELIGKALELADKVQQHVNAVFIGSKIHAYAEELLHYGVQKVFVYDEEELAYFRVDNYVNAFEDCILKSKPAAVLVGATSVGRSLAPRCATRFHTGLTADCTLLDMRENTDLVQIRPAFGGNIMAQILTSNHRPQFATVRYKVMDPAQRSTAAQGEIIPCQLTKEQLHSSITMHQIEKLQQELSISEAEVLVVAGAGVKDDKTMELVQQLAELLHGMVGVTRPMVESGRGSYLQQIGLSGRTVKPKLIITCGVSGAIQFVAGMKSSDLIIAINQDEHAPIFDVAHYAVIGNLEEILPTLIEKIKGGAQHAAAMQ